MDPRWRLYRRARDAFGAVLDALNIGQNGGYVLLPAYVGWSSREGSGIYDPIQQRSLKARFYRMQSDLTIDVDDLELLLNTTPEAAALVVVHYFGRPDPNLGKIVALARGHQVKVIEDAAHAYFTAELSAICGNVGDAVLYSVHKMFDVSEGGVLKLNSTHLEGRIPKGGAGQVAVAGWTRVFDEDIAAHAAARVRNYQVVATQVEPLSPSVVPLWESLPQGTIPQTFPVRVSHTALRDRLYFGLKREGFEVSSLYHNLISSLTDNDFPVSAGVSQTIFNIPLAPSMSEADIEHMGKVASEIVRERR